jgi:SsrA-binding protein
MTTYASNKKAFYSYSVEEQAEAGLALTGHEVKSIRGGNASLMGAYVTIRGGEVFLRNAHIGKYKHAANPESIDETRERKLLMHKKEIERLAIKSKEKGISIIPLELYSSKGLIKLKVALARGKKQYDKRASIKTKELRKKIDRVVKRTIK